ncbi:Rhodanese domain-containing protein [Schizosaccharomyces pombe]|uniref:Uncharacterized protein UNK4.09 n=1 Tax=Schizosaccharomyces pombe (strain 972 / ATCC 24843) TaxID=284812 RepID=YEA9_SCHPO|nr:uncharacterized protein SPACUNK4.09 [Schizosaccharomyces pombe]O14074.1 RecName: Full=Uncharacterized protein UNK4.09 [Schizosaccharomyces pombe 972h-]CAA20139.1 conserved protein [Schizosaccharomyces pombe]|eukprot:NP_593969.1 uncharacterized protein SPACUNK4.09 [Schizosaccharomyces pombe]
MQMNSLNDPKHLVKAVVRGEIKCLDVRAQSKYEISHLRKSVNIPSEKISKCWYQLPAKQEELFVVEDQGDKIETEETGTCAQQLKKRGWNIAGHFMFSHKIWEDLSLPQNELLESGPNRNLLFEPCPYLKEVMPVVEKGIKTNNARVLDIGCGSGRDLAWICFRESGKHWMVSALDAEKRAIQRFSELFSGLGLEDRIEGKKVAKVDASGLWKLYTRDGKQEPNATAISLADMLADFQNVPEGDVYKYDLVLQIRFLNRALLRQSSSLLRNNGFLFLCTFVNDGVHQYEHPRGSDHRFEKGEAAAIVSESDGRIRVLKDEIGFIEDGRPVQILLAQKVE